MEIKETHVRTVTKTFRYSELKVLLAEMVAKEAGMSKPHIEGSVHRASSVTAKVGYEDECEGSPGYRVGVSIKVTLTQDMLSAPATECDGPV